MGYRVKVLEVEHRNNETRILQSVQLTPPYNKEITFRQIRITNGLGLSTKLMPSIRFMKLYNNGRASYILPQQNYLV